MTRRSFLAITAFSCLIVQAAELTAEQRKLNVDSFDYAWKKIKETSWMESPAGLDWEKLKSELRPKMEAAKTMNEARGVIREMISRLKMTHFNLVPAEVYESLGDAVSPGKGGDGEPGFDLRVLDGQAIVTKVEPDAPAAKQGVKTGWRVAKVDGQDVSPIIEKLSANYKDSTLRDLMLGRAVAARLDGPVGGTVKTEFLDGNDQPVTIDVQLKQPRGIETKLGFMPNQRVWFESKKIGNVGYIAFNMFMDPARIATLFADAVQSFAGTDGIIIDLRGNPGGIGGMSMGMAGWFIDKPNQKLGVMKTKDTEINFVLNPRSQVYNGPLAILIDGMTGSTSEIFSGGLKDLGRARIIGTRSAGAALPSVFEKLPNGDGFQYAIANYISKGGKPLEGIGVIPDQEVKLTRKALLEGRDPVEDAALDWIRKERGSK
jgi:carboxyl-terminal processing protease